ncbi:MAG: hypothetical protein CVU11_12955 [Bacteroidetes bacterium HGW-Bacteroidetes-6]|jgi:hypothetical protein|nr:MAG: hypothetical protein CVU11_12955 [Bacteroidetes bacterium HGW-Bacteroidetes-6]
MKKIQIAFVAILVVLLSACGASHETKTKTIDSKKENGATISVKNENTSDTLKPFPTIPDKLFLNAREASCTEGSFSSIGVECSDTIDDVVYKLSVRLPAGKKFNLRNRADGSIEFITDKLPCTISGNDYQPYKNALSDDTMRVEAVFEVRDMKNKTYDYLIFSLGNLTIYAMEENDSRLSAHFDFDGISGKYSQPAYGLYSAHIEIEVEKMIMNLIMVD